MGVKVFGVSLDDVATQAAFAKKESASFPLLSDPDGSASGRLGVMMADKPYTNRWTYVIDDKGILRILDRKVSPSTHGPDLVAAIKALK